MCTTYIYIHTYICSIVIYVIIVYSHIVHANNLYRILLYGILGTCCILDTNTAPDRARALRCKITLGTFNIIPSRYMDADADIAADIKFTDRGPWCRM